MRSEQAVSRADMICQGYGNMTMLRSWPSVTLIANARTTQEVVNNYYSKKTGKTLTTE